MNEQIKDEIAKVMEKRFSQKIYLMGNIDEVLKGKTPTEILSMQDFYDFDINDRYFFIDSYDKLISFDDLDGYLMDEYEELNQEEQANILNEAIKKFNKVYVVSFKRAGESVQYVDDERTICYWGENSEDDYIFFNRNDANKIAKEIKMIYPNAVIKVEEINNDKTRS